MDTNRTIYNRDSNLQVTNIYQILGVKYKQNT